MTISELRRHGRPSRADSTRRHSLTGLGGALTIGVALTVGAAGAHAAGQSAPAAGVRAEAAPAGRVLQSLTTIGPSHAPAASTYTYTAPGSQTTYSDNRTIQDGRLTSVTWVSQTQIAGGKLRTVSLQIDDVHRRWTVFHSTQPPYSGLGMTSTPQQIKQGLNARHLRRLGSVTFDGRPLAKLALPRNAFGVPDLYVDPHTDAPVAQVQILHVPKDKGGSVQPLTEVQTWIPATPGAIAKAKTRPGVPKGFRHVASGSF